MNGAIAKVLNKVLGDWIENLNPENLNLSVFSGDILLQDLSLKSSAFNNLGLPFKLQLGYVGKISAKIPWTTLGSSPLRVTLENLHIFLSPIPTTEWKEDFEVSRFYSNKLSRLAQLDVINSSEIDSKKAGFVEKLVGKIVHNIQIEIKGIFVRYYDDISSSCPFAFGIAVDEVRAVTCSQDWNEEFIEESSVMFKLVQVKGLRVFLDYSDLSVSECVEIAKMEFNGNPMHTYILPPTVLRLEAIVNKNPNDFSIPQVRLDFTVSTFQYNIDVIQIKHLIRTSNFFKIFSIFQQGIISDIKQSEFNADEAEKYRNLVIQMKTPSKSKEKNEGILKEIEGIEKEKKWEELVAQRKAANKEFELMKLEAATQEEIASSTAGPSNYSRLTSFFSRKAADDTDKKEKLEKLKQKLEKINEERAKIASEIESFVDDVEVFSEVPTGFIRFSFHFKMQEFLVEVCEGSKRFLQYKVLSPNLELLISSSFFSVTAGIQCSELLDLQESSVFPYIIRSKEYELALTNKEGIRIKMRSGDLEVILKLNSLLNTINALKEPFVTDFDYSKYTQNATEKTKKYIEAGEKYLSQIMKNGIKTSLTLDIDLKAPKFIIPLTPTSSESNLIIDFGRIKMTSAPETLEGNLYDRYVFYLFEFEITRKSSNPSSEPYSNIMSPISIEVILHNSLTDNRQVPSLILAINYPSISFTIRDSDVLFLLALQKEVLKELANIPKPPKIDPELLNIKTDIELSMIMKFNFKLQCIKFTLISEEISLTTAEISDFSVDVIIKDSKDIDCSFYIGYIEVRDNRNGVEINKIVCNPALQVNDDDEFADALEEIKQLSGKFRYDGAVAVEIIMNDVRFALAAEFAQELMKFARVFSEIKSNISENMEIDQVSEVKPTSANISFKAELTNITILVPIDSRDLNKRVGLFNVSISVDFSSKKTAENGVYLYYNDECSLTFKRITSVIGLFANNTVKNTQQKKESLLQPTQFAVTYHKFLEQSELTASAEINLDRIHVEVGFRDLDFFQKLANTWQGLQVPSSGPPAKSAPSSPIKLQLALSSLTLTLTDDTTFKPLSLLFLSFNQTEFSIASRLNEFSCKISSRLYIHSFNGLNPEPILEDWTFSAKLSIEKEKVPFNFQISSEQLLTINISENLIKSVSKLNEKFTQNPEFWAMEVLDEGRYERAKVVNLFGEDVIISVPDENTRLLLKNDSFYLKNRSGSTEKFESHFIVQFDNNQIYIEACGVSKEFSVKRNNLYVGCLLKLVENLDEITYYLQTETLLVNFNDIDFEISSNNSKFTLLHKETVPLPLSYAFEDLKVLTETGPSVFSKCFELSGRFYTIEKISAKDSSSYLHLFYVFLPTFYIQNQLPYPMTISHKPITSLSFTILPGETLSLPIDPRALGKLQIALQMEELTPSFWFDLPLSTCNIKLTSNSNKLTVENSEYDVVSQLLGFVPVNRSQYCRQFTIYARYILVNKSQNKLELKKGLEVEKSSLAFLSIKRDKLKMRVVEKKFSRYCKEINTKTIGVAGCISFDNSSNDSVQELLLGVQISAGQYPLMHSKIITISPRYLISNLTSRDLYIRQMINGKGSINITRLTGENFHFQLENSIDSKVVQISTNGQEWSPGFNIEEITEFQTSVSSVASERSDSGPWYLPSPVNDNRTFIQIIISTEDQSTILIHFKHPSHPEFLIANYTSFPLTLCKDKYSYTIPPSVEFPWADSNKVTIRKGGQTIEYSLLKVKKKKKQLYDIDAEVKISGVTRILELGSRKEKGAEVKKVTSNSELKAGLAGISVSVFNEKSSEILLFTVLDIFVWARIKEKNGEKRLKLDSRVKKVQLDNMAKEDTQYGVMFSGSDDSETPFFQLKLQRTSTATFTRFPWIEATFQEMVIQLNQEVIYNILSLITKLKETFIKTLTYPPITPENFSLIFPYLQPLSLPELSFNQSSLKIYVNYMRLYALKFSISFKVPHKKFEFKLDPRRGFGVFSAAGSLASSFVNITDSALVFTEVLLTDSFQTPQQLADILIQNYKQQGIRQIYRVLGSSDMLGNPIRLMNKLGTGVFEFISEPVKGVLKGPRGFKDGVKVGVKSVVSNIMGGGLQTVSTITGNLYNVVNKVKGSEQQDLGGEKIKGSIVGGLKDLGKGLTGIFSKPLQGLKNEGGGGFVKGIGSGIMGAVTAPISAGLRISSGITAQASAAVSVKRPELIRIREPKILGSK